MPGATVLAVRRQRPVVWRGGATDTQRAMDSYATMPAQTLPGANGCMPSNGVLDGAIWSGSERDDGKHDPGAANGGGKSKAGATVFFPEVWRTFPIVVHVLGSPLTTPPRGEVVFHSETIRNFPVWLCGDERV